MTTLETSKTHTFRGDAGEVSLAVKTAVAAGNSTNPGFVWLGGYRSDMSGTKAQTMVECAAHLGSDSVRFDYSGHGESAGEFADGCISDWVAQSIDIVRTYTTGSVVLVGSSMGGWISLRVVQELQKLGEQDRLSGLLLIAPAPDFTEELMKPQFTPDQLIEMRDNGFISEPSEYSDEPNIITQKLIEDGARNLVFSDELNLNVPVRILQGMKDPDVPFKHALRLVDHLIHDDVSITLVKGGDHRLSRDEDIALLKRTMGEFILQ